MKVHTSRTQVDSKVFINLHAWNHCPGPALSPKWLENYMEPHASSEILTRSDLTIWLNPKRKVLAHKLSEMCRPLLGGLGACSPRTFEN